MDEYRYESLLDENANFKKALASTKHVLERTINDYETLKQIHEDYKHQYERLRQENDETNNKYLQIASEKKEVENHFDSTIRNFKIAIEQKQKELEDVQAKIIPTLDHDMMRIKIINELELPHRQALDAKNAEIEKLQDQIYELKRQNDMLSTKFEAVRYEAEKDIKDLKERHKLEMSDLILEIQTLQDRFDDTRDKEIIRSLRKELDEFKIKYEEVEQEINDTMEEKDKLRDEKNEILLKLNKQIENERADRRAAKTEADKAHVRVRQLELEIQNLQNKVLDKEKDNQLISTDLYKLQEDYDQKLKQIAGLQQQLSTLEENQVFNQSKWQEYITRQQVTSHEKQLSEKNRINELQRELEKYQKTIVDLENKNRNLNFQTLKDMDTVRAENQRLNEAHLSLQRTIDLREEEIRNLKHEVQRLQDDISNLQRINRELQSYKENYQLNINQQQQNKAPTVIVQKEDNQKSEGLAKSLSEALAREQKYKHKIVRLKQKLRKANEKIMELLPYKLEGNNIDTEDILRKYRSANYGAGIDVQREIPNVNYQIPGGEADDILRRFRNTGYGLFRNTGYGLGSDIGIQREVPNLNYQPQGEGGEVIKELRKKYGFVNYADDGNRQEDPKYGGGAARRDEFETRFEKNRDVVDRYDDEVQKISADYRSQQPQTRTRGFAPQESLGSVGYDEIKRFADDEALKYRGFK